MFLEHPGLALAAFLSVAEGIRAFFLPPPQKPSWLLGLIPALAAFDTAFRRGVDGLSRGSYGELAFALAGTFVFMSIWTVPNRFKPASRLTVDRISKRDTEAALLRAAASHGLDVAVKQNRIAFPTLGVGGTDVRLWSSFGGTSLEFLALDRTEARTAARTLTPMLRNELASVQTRSAPWDLGLSLAVAAGMILIARQF